MNLFQNYTDQQLLSWYDDLEYSVDYDYTISNYEKSIYKKQMKQIAKELTRRAKEKSTPRTIADQKQDELA